MGPRVVSSFDTPFNANVFVPEHINQYRRSLALPLLWGFVDIDLLLPLFSMLSRAFTQIRPMLPRPES